MKHRIFFLAAMAALVVFSGDEEQSIGAESAQTSPAMNFFVSSAKSKTGKKKLKSYNLLPCDFEGKIDFIRLMLREYKLNDSDWIFVGDGANDVHIAKEAPVSIGYNPHAELRSVVTKSVDKFSDILSILDG